MSEDQVILPPNLSTVPNTDDVETLPLASELALEASGLPPRAVLVTGAARRMGKEISLTLATQGWDVAIHCRHSRDEAQTTADDIRAMGRRAAVLVADLSDEAACRELVPAAVLALGRLDAVVNSAATFEFDDAATFTYELLERHLRANTAPAIVLAQALADHVAERDAAATSRRQDADGEPEDPPAAVVNMLDQKLWNPNPDFLSYTLSKAALESATTLLALALAPRVRVVGVAPGLTLTSDTLQGERFDAMHRQSPLGRSSTAADVAATVAFALANRSITGTTLLVDGGQHLQRFDRDFSKM